MANLSQTVTNSLNLFGVAPSDKWNAYAWNAFKWGEGTQDLGVHIIHAITNSITPDTTVIFSVTKLLSNTLTVTEDMSSERLTDSEGYAYVFPDNTTELEGRDFTTWTAGTSGSATWTSGTTAVTTWS